MIELKEKFYVTTPIFYINDVPSVGSVYPAIAADILARFHKLKGEKTFFLTGVDENSQKTVQAAKEKGYKDLQKYADEMAGKWKNAFKKLDISNDGFIRTTEERHKNLVKEFFLKVHKNGDIYKGKYEGLYCEGCEAFLLEKDLVEGLCPFHKKPPKRIVEENYFFKLSNYQEQLLKHIEKNPEFILPSSRRNEVTSFLKSGVKDISISRPGLEWGITLPIDEKQKFWVWFDALNNYISGSEGNWPAELHIIGKDILRFHCVIWPAMLLSAGYELPKTIFAHGFFTIEGQKMSKSLGNAIDPIHLTEKYSVDALRYFLFREIPFGEDGDFSEKALIQRINSDLADDLGNLLNRTIIMIQKYFKGEIPEGSKKGKKEKELIDFSLKKAKEADAFLEKYEFNRSLSSVWEIIASGNRFINESKPWELAKEGKKEELAAAMNALAELLRITSILLLPFIPSASEKIQSQLGIKSNKFSEAFEWNLIPKKTRTGKAEILFQKVK
ncbi:MAG: methionine--tRNA ligase [archaeon]